MTPLSNLLLYAFYNAGNAPVWQRVHLFCDLGRSMCICFSTGARHWGLQMRSALWYGLAQEFNLTVSTPNRHIFLTFLLPFDYDMIRRNTVCLSPYTLYMTTSGACGDMLHWSQDCDQPFYIWIQGREKIWVCWSYPLHKRVVWAIISCNISYFGDFISPLVFWKCHSILPIDSILIWTWNIWEVLWRILSEVLMKH